METPEFPIEKTNSRPVGPSGPNVRAEPRPIVYRYLDSPEGDGAPDYGNLRDYWRIFVRYKMTLLAFTVAGLLAAILISLFQTPVYRVRTSLQIQDANFPEMKGTDSNDSSNSTPSESYVETQVKLLQSEYLLEHVIDMLQLHKEKTGTGWRAIAARAHRFFQLSGDSRLPEREQLIRQAQRNLTVQTSGNSRMLEVLYESPDPKLAADFANTLVSQFIELSQEERWKSAQRTADWLTNHLNEMKSQLEQSEAQLQDYARTAGLTVTAEKDNLAEDKLKELQEELSKAQADRIAKQARLEEARSKAPDSLPEVSEDPTMRQYRQKLADLQEQYAELSATLTPQHYKVQRVQAQINELKAQIQKERSSVLRRIGNEYAAALRREQLLSGAHNNQANVVEDKANKAIHYDTLKRDVDTNRRLYEVLLQKVKEASIAAAMRDSNVIVVDRAKPPLTPYRPSYPINSAIGLLGGVFLGLGFVMFRERIDRRISAPGDVQVYLDLPELGVIPWDEFGVPRQISRGLHAQRPTGVLPAESVKKSSLRDCPELATWKRRPSLLAECARTTLISLLLPSADGDRPHVLVFTSPSPGDGKTTVACNLSIAMAEIGQKVLLIDGDLRRPRLHKVFGVANARGLSDVLWENTGLETVPISQLVRVTEISGLCLLPGGSCSVTPSNLFYSARMSKLLGRLRMEFDMVVIDAPPMIHLADARVLGRLADGVILVIRAGETTADKARFATQRFAEDGTRVLGIVLNKWDPKTPGRYGYESYYNYQTHVAR